MVESDKFTIIEDLKPGHLSISEIICEINGIETLGLKISKDKQTDFGLCMQANTLGTLALKAGDYVRAERLLQKANEKYCATRDLLPYSHLMYNLGNVYMALKDHGKALEYYHKAM